MKHAIIVIILSFGLFAVAQESPVVWETDIKKAVDVSIEQKKPLFLFFTGSDWCGVCVKLQKEVFAYPQFQDWAKKNVVLVELDFPRNKQPDPVLQEQNTPMKEMFGITGYPTIVFVNPAKNALGTYYTRIGSLGYKAGGPDVWLEAANQILP
ncbi:MAG: thioredoxin family protein [Chitinophagales bacterium]|nr:thioredoxin family protein [Chitinophagales bacterium]